MIQTNPQVQRWQQDMRDKQMVQRAMTVGNTATPFGTNFFDMCHDALMTLHYQARLPLQDWMGFQVDDTVRKPMEFIEWIRPASGNSAGAIADPCADPNGVEFGTTDLDVGPFGRYGRLGPTREMMKPMRWCDRSPLYRLDGTQVTSETEWDLYFATSQLIDDIEKDTISGNSSNTGEMDGLENIVKTGYDSPMLDSTVIDWNSNDMNGGAGVTWNGTAINGTPNFIDMLVALVRRIKQRISWAPLLQTQNMNLGDIIIVAPHDTILDILSAFTCWSVCPGKQYNETNLDTYEARSFRDSLMGGYFGYGSITIDQMTIPLLGYDKELMKTETKRDVYLLVRSVGNFRMWEAQHLDANVAARSHGDQGMSSRDGGRMLLRKDSENECYHWKVWMHPRMWCRAPWAQVRLTNVLTQGIAPVLSPDPASSFFPQQSFDPATFP